MQAGDDRARLTRDAAGRWQWVREQWHNDPTPPWMRGTGDPDEVTWQRQTLLEAVRCLGRIRAIGQRY